MKKTNKNKFANIQELIKDLESYSGLSIDLNEVDTKEKLLDKIQYIENFLSNEVSDICRKYRSDVEDVMSNTYVKCQKCGDMVLQVDIDENEEGMSVCPVCLAEDEFPEDFE